MVLDRIIGLKPGFKRPSRICCLDKAKPNLPCLKCTNILTIVLQILFDKLDNVGELPLRLSLLMWACIDIFIILKKYSFPRFVFISNVQLSSQGDPWLESVELH